MPLSPAERVARARLAAYARWSKPDQDPSAQGRAGQEGLRRRIRREVILEDPLVQEPELSRRVQVRYKAHFERLRFASLRAQAARAAQES